MDMERVGNKYYKVYILAKKNITNMMSHFNTWHNPDGRESK